LSLSTLSLHDALPILAFFLKSHPSRINHLRNAADVSIIILGGFIEFSALHVDAVFGAFQLRLQFHEVLSGFQLRIFLNGDKQSRSEEHTSELQSPDHL